MTTYKLKDIDSLLKKKRDTFEKIVYVMASSKKKGLTTKEIYKRGRKLFLNDFPTNKITVLRYLNTMLQYDMVQKIGWYWFLRETKVPFKEIIAKLDIKSIEESLKFENEQLHRVIVFPNVALYGASPFLETLFEKEFKKLLKDLEKVYKKLWELNINAVILGTSQDDLNKLIDKNLSEIDRMIIMTLSLVTMKYLYSEFVDKELNISGEEIKFLQIINAPNKKLFIRENEEIKLNTNYIMVLADLIKKYFPKKSKEWIIHQLKNYEASKRVIKIINEIMMNDAEFLSQVAIHGYAPTIVINPFRRKILIKRREMDLPKGYFQSLINFLSRSDLMPNQI